MSDRRAQYQEAFEAFTEGNYDAAIERYRALLEVEAGFALGWQGLAEAYSRKGQLEEAVGAIRKAIDIEPGEALFHTSLSRFYQMQGKIPEAEEVAAVAQKLQSGGP